ncbi:INO80 complex subunit E-like protein [Dinothrombium tinctorium]|uniref:INO80 complex subunit E-like protein n=1 Tax=Dinothrombium tinctorium TaxID=1965070 RepID=A0A3S3RUQ7_9ACAR|nr:INO80 complex subunit E-like protein [Dinothrombium tinctorium]RWS06310.1 INO80 complex subunit E-like protein [Dinothrombium tinctorium]
MPVFDESRGNNQNIDFKQKYRNLKRKLKLLIYENEYYSEELRKTQRQLLQVTRDKNFLLDKLLTYENLNSTTSDSDATDSSDSEDETNQIKSENANKKKKTSEHNVSPTVSPNVASNTTKKKKTSVASTVSRTKTTNVTTTTMSTPATKLTRPVVITPSIKPSSTSTQVVAAVPVSCVISESSSSQSASQSALLSVNANIDGQLTCEEIERHFESRQVQPSLLMPEKAPLTVPVEMFSNESSTGLSEERN